MLRLAICFWRLGPYHHARLRAAARMAEVEAIEFVATDTIYAWDVVEGAEGFARTTLHDAYTDSRGARRAAEAAMAAALSRFQPDVVAIPGWSTADALMALRWCRRHGRPAVLMSDSNAWDASRNPLGETVKSRVVAQYAAALVAGSNARQYLTCLGMPAAAVSLGYDAVDNDHFARGAEAARREEAAVRQRLGLPRRYFLASARFLARKNLERLLEAFAIFRAAINADSEEWDLVILGDGPLRTSLERRREALGLGDRVHFPGFIQYPDLPAYYALASAFIHASLIEQWGLVVNEAMASGLPVLISRRCGCAADLVQEGINGFLFNPSDTAALADIMLRFACQSTRQSAAMGEASRTLIADWGPDRFAAGLVTAAEYARSVPTRRPHFMDRLILEALLRR